MAIDDGAASKLGWKSLLGYGEETTYGTRVVPTRSFEFTSEALTQDRQRLESSAIRNSEFQSSWGEGSVSSGGAVTHELANKGFGLLFKHALGTVATSQPDAAGSPTVYDHVFTPGDLTGLSLTAQVVRDDLPFDYTGCKLGSLSLACDVDAFATVVANLVGREELTDQAAHAEAFPTDFSLLTFIHGSVTIGGTETAVNSANVEINNGLDENRRRLGSALRRNPQRVAFRNFTGTFNADFIDLTAYNRYVSGAEAELVLDFEGGAIENTYNYRTRIRANIRTDGTTPTVGSPEEIRQELTFKAFPGGAVATALEVSYRTSDSTP